MGRMDTRLVRGNACLPAATGWHGSQQTLPTTVGATIHPDHLAAAADACAVGLTHFEGSRAVSAGDAVRRYGWVEVLLSDGVSRLCLSVREPGLHRRRVFLPEGLTICEMWADWRYVAAGESHRSDLAHDLPELARRLLPVMHRTPGCSAQVRALVRALRDQLPAVEAAALAGLPVPTPWSVPRRLIPTQDDRLDPTLQPVL